MDITFYLNHSENNRIKKALTDATTISGFCRDKVDLMNPVLYVEQDPRDFNYLYVRQFNRYYYINKISTVRNGLWSIECTVDVLRTYQTQILALYAIVDKQETVSNKYLDDGSWILENRKINEIYNFSSGFLTSPEYILVTAGNLVV